MAIAIERLTEHVLRVALPTPTLPPSYETNTYVIHQGEEALVVDVGSDDPAIIEELASVLRQLGVLRVHALIATHYHRDHTQGFPLLRRHFPAPIQIHALDLANLRTSLPDVHIQPVPDAYHLGTLRVAIQHHPGHTHGHIHLHIPNDDVLLVGDHLSGDGSVWVGPPDGHMAHYYAALEAIANSGCRIVGAGHGRIAQDAETAARELLLRRQRREAEIAALIRQSPRTLNELVFLLYGNSIPEAATWVARRTVQAHIEHLLAQRQIERTWHTAGHMVYTAPSHNPVSP
ncbi:hypothetical protein GCM10025857_36440 [Alicyclobacillus contaminans]|uniref:MBL fold metallo-hydrolase n=1 Tax=Alicyclobacillus contaminans TaxID=392016 RepID=UPI000406BCD0|nr:MBL fold metallo-hydrolase [Alicyclobacillus contaminans]GMA52287.1 hypothetical protein GCM10025857_36440 [Alicyclobacillus contaminans]